MKLYVWHNILCDYTCGIAFALAASVEDARRQIVERFVADEMPIDVITRAILDEPAVHDTPMAYYQYGGG